MGDRTRLIVEDDSMGLRALVSFERWDSFDGKPVYGWSIMDTSGVYGAGGSDLRLGSASEPNDAEAMRALLSFFGAWIESIQYERRTGSESDNDDLFPAALRPFAECLDADAVAMLASSSVGEDE
jgi:hypothetical protein